VKSSFRREQRRRAGVAALVAAAVAALLAVLAGAGTASAADAPAHSLVLRRVDSTDPSKTLATFSYDGDANDVKGAKLTENGKAVKLAAEPQQVPAAQRGIVFVVDASASTDKTAVLAKSKEAINELVAKLPKGIPYALVSTGDQVSLVQRFTLDTNEFSKQVSQIKPFGEGALWGGVVRAVSQYDSEPTMLPTIVLLTDGVDKPTIPFSDAQAAVAGSGAQVFAVAVQGGPLTSEPKMLADSSAGGYLQTATAGDLSSLLVSLSPKVSGQYQVTYASSATQGVTNLDLSVGGVTVTNSYVPGSVATGASELARQTPVGRSGVQFFQNGLGKLLAVVLALVAAALAAFGLISVAFKEPTALDTAMRTYAEGYGSRAREDDDDEGDQPLAQTAFVQRAVELTGEFADRQGFLTKVEGALERANLPLRGPEAIFFTLAGTVLLTLLVGFATQDPIITIGLFFILALTPFAALSYMANKRKKEFEAQLPDMLQLLAGTLRAGYSIMQGVEAVSQEVDEPMGRELRRVVTEARLGRPLEEALDSVAERLESGDFAWAVMAIRIQREVGGNLSELLMTVAETMTQRERLRRDVRTLTAEGRISAYILGVMPVGIGFAMYLINPDYMRILFDENIGRVMLGTSLVLMVGGFAWLRQIVKIEV
jgi:tight adherence protein B